MAAQTVTHQLLHFLVHILVHCIFSHCAANCETATVMTQELVSFNSHTCPVIAQAILQLPLASNFDLNWTETTS